MIDFIRERNDIVLNDNNINNLDIWTNESGQFVTNDERLNDALRRMEQTTGKRLAILMPAVTFDEEPVDVESKVYLLLLTVYPVSVSDYYNEDRIDIEQNTKEWSVSIGRQNTYEYLRNMIISGAINPNESFILSGSQPIEEALTVFRFMKIMADQNKILEVTDFDIDEYSGYTDMGDKKLIDS